VCPRYGLRLPAIANMPRFELPYTSNLHAPIHFYARLMRDPYSYNDQHRSSSASSRHATRASRYDDPYADYNVSYSRKTSRTSYGTTEDAYRAKRNRASSHESIDDYRNRSRYASRTSSGRSGNRVHNGIDSRKARENKRSTHSTSTSRRQRAAQMQQADGNRRPLIICIIILVILDIALAIGIYSCGASLDEQAAARGTKAAPQASQAAFIVDSPEGSSNT